MLQEESDDRTDHARPDVPFRRTDPLGLPDEYARLRQEEPISRVRIWDGSQPWLVTSFELCRQILGDRRFSSDASRPGFPNQSPNRPTNANFRALIRLDPPEHTRYRRMLSPEFMIQRVEEMRPDIQAIADDLLDAMARRTPPVDLVPAFALPLPSLVICRLLGVPVADRPFFESRSRGLIANPAATREAIQVTFDELRAYIDQLVTAKAENPADDVLSRLVERERAGELTHVEVVDTSLLLLLAGHVTTANMIGLGVLILLRNPEQFAGLRRDPGLTRGAVEELLRHLTLIQAGLRRVATEDVEVGGRRIRAGEGVILLISAANRDQRFDEPERFDIRHQVRHHLAFGYGFHQCLGQLLARVELQIALDSIGRRFPTLALAGPVEEVPFREDGFLLGVTELPVTW